jgi:glycosyltransferase involved in cell wall biosynthesis
MDRANWALASYLSRSGCQPHLVTHYTDKELTEHHNVIVHRVSKPLDSFFLAAPLLDLVGRSWARRLRVEKARVIVNGGNCLWHDVNWVHYVHAAWSNAPGGVRASLSRRLSVLRERRAISSARFVISNAHQTKFDLTSKLGVSANRIAMSYYGIDPAIFYPVDQSECRRLRSRLGLDDARPLVIFVGGLSDRRKGFDSAFRAWTQLCARSAWDADLLVVGIGAELGYWKRRAREEGVDNRIHFLGFRSDVHDLMRACDALIAPARYEPFGLAVQEALCCGLAAIVSRSAGVSELYPEDLHDLVLPNPEDADDLADRLLRWRADVSSYRKRVISLAERLRRYTWDDMAREIVTAIEAHPIQSVSAARDPYDQSSYPQQPESMAKEI